jgi:hypothetical protein
MCTEVFTKEEAQREANEGVEASSPTMITHATMATHLDNERTMMESPAVSPVEPGEGQNVANELTMLENKNTSPSMVRLEKNLTSMLSKQPAPPVQKPAPRPGFARRYFVVGLVVTIIALVAIGIVMEHKQEENAYQNVAKNLHHPDVASYMETFLKKYPKSLYRPLVLMYQEQLIAYQNVVKNLAQQDVLSYIDKFLKKYPQSSYTVMVLSYREQALKEKEGKGFSKIRKDKDKVVKPEHKKIHEDKPKTHKDGLPDSPTFFTSAGHTGTTKGMGMWNVNNKRLRGETPPLARTYIQWGIPATPWKLYMQFSLTSTRILRKQPKLFSHTDMPEGLGVVISYPGEQQKYVVKLRPMGGNEHILVIEGGKKGIKATLDNEKWSVISSTGEFGENGDHPYLRLALAGCRVVISELKLVKE